MFLTIVMGIRNRASERLVRCFSSLAQQTFQDFRVILVDYGSDPEAARLTSEIAGRFPFCHYVYTETRGYPWNRSHALNIGARMADTLYLMTTDVDMLFPRNFLEVAVSRVGETKVLHCGPIFLPQDFRSWEHFEDAPGQAEFGGSHLGGCQIILTKLFHSIRGFDEVFQYWGAEDRDMHQRLTRMGIKTEWLNDQTVIYHQWHPQDNYRFGYSLPDGFWGRINAYYYRMLGQMVRNGEDWGRIHTKEDRPVYSFIDFEKNRLRQRDDLKMFYAVPDLNESAGMLVREIFQTPKGHALVVMGADYPVRPSFMTRVMGWTNLLLDKLQAGFRIGYSPNLLHAFLAEFIEQHPGLICDFYINFPVQGGVTVLVSNRQDESA